MKTVRRVERAHPGREWVATYYLCCDEAPTGTSFYYVKCYLESWNGTLLLRERLGTADLPECDRFRATAFFKKVTRASSVVHPEHLTDIVHDELMAQTLPPRGHRCKITSLPIRRHEEPETGRRGTT